MEINTLMNECIHFSPTHRPPNFHEIFTNQIAIRKSLECYKKSRCTINGTQQYIIPIEFKNVNMYYSKFFNIRRLVFLLFHQKKIIKTVKGGVIQPKSQSEVSQDVTTVSNIQ